MPIEEQRFFVTKEDSDRLMRHNIAAGQKYQAMLDDGSEKPYVHIDVRPGGALRTSKRRSQRQPVSVRHA